jgi:hypothetical protein
MMDEPLTAPEPAGHPERARRLEPLFNAGGSFEPVALCRKLSLQSRDLRRTVP